MHDSGRGRSPVVVGGGASVPRGMGWTESVGAGGTGGGKWIGVPWTPGHGSLSASCMLPKVNGNRSGEPRLGHRPGKGLHRGQSLTAQWHQQARQRVQGLAFMPRHVKSPKWAS